MHFLFNNDKNLKKWILHGGNPNVCKAEINAKLERYKATCSGTLEYAKKFYKNLFYIGSGHITYINGVKVVEKELHHFFI